MFKNISRLIKFDLIPVRQISNNCKVGFIGLGNMGAFMSVNLLKAGHEIVAFDMNEERINHLRKLATGHKINIVKSIKEFGNISDLESVITMLPSSPQVNAVYVHEGLLEAVKRNTLFIDCTTGDPAVSQSIAKKARSYGTVYVDAPVSGGVNAARDALLTFMVGGENEQVDEASKLLKKMGKNIFHCGPIGTGLAAKICNNMLLAISMIGVAEAMCLGTKLGLDPSVLAKVINSSSGRCWSSDTYNPVPGVIPGVPASKNYEGGFGVALMAKDLGLSELASVNNNVSIPLGSAAHQIYRMLSERGYSNKDFSIIYKYLSEQQ